MPGTNYPVQPAAITDLIDGLAAILQNSESYTASGRAPKNPASSMARLPDIELTTRSGGGMASGLSDNMLKNPTYETTRMRDVAANLQRAKIDEILSKIDLNLPTPQAAPAPGRMPGLQPLAQMAGRFAPVLTLLELLTQAGDLSRGEDEDLAARRRMPPTLD